MLTAEIKINGKPIGHIEARRTFYTGKNGHPLYSVDGFVDDPVRGGAKTGRHRYIEHNPEDGALDLIGRAFRPGARNDHLWFDEL